MLSRFLEFVRKHNLADKKEQVLLAVSGGIDSMTMWHLFRSAGYKIAIAHCNFLLRGDQSDNDEKFVTDLAAKQKVPFFSTRFKTKNYASTRGLSVQMAARELRYEWFRGLLAENGYDKVATAHHLDDNI